MNFIKENNELRDSQILNTPANEMTKIEFISMNILSGLLKSNPDIDVEELTNRAIELSKTLIKKINS